MEVTREGQPTQRFYSNGVDYFRESVPFEGRW